MKTGTLFRSGLAVVQERFFNKKTPLMIGWALTNRCNLKCIYCNSHKIASKELDTDTILNIIDETKRLGTKVIAYTGGEPLLREDIVQILEYTKTNGIYTMLITNGILLPQKKDVLKWTDTVTISLDGPKQIHDLQRGDGSHKRALEAVEYLLSQNKKAEITVTLTKYNVNELDYFFALSRKLGVLLTFQAVTVRPLGLSSIDGLLPSKQDLNKAYTKILNEKRCNEWITHSIPGIKYYLDAPDLKKLNCYAGRLFCRIRSDGKVDACSQFEQDNARDSSLVGYEEAFLHTKKSVCQGCWCSNLVEFNNIVNGDIESLINSIKFLK